MKINHDKHINASVNIKKLKRKSDDDMKMREAGLASSTLSSEKKRAMFIKYEEEKFMKKYYYEIFSFQLLDDVFLPHINIKNIFPPPPVNNFSHFIFLSHMNVNSKRTCNILRNSL